MLLYLLATLLPAQAPERGPANPVAVVLSVSGTPTRTADGKALPARRLDVLRPGDRLEAGPGGGATVLFVSDGHHEALHTGASITVKPSGGEPTGRVERLAPTLAGPSLAALRDKVRRGKILGGRLRSVEEREPVVGSKRNDELKGIDPTADDGPGPPVAPVNGSVVTTDRPTLRWPSLPRADIYRVELLSAAAGANETVLFSRDARRAELPFPADLPPLARVHLYRWRVEAVTPDGEIRPLVRESRFFVGPTAIEAQAAELSKMAGGRDPARVLVAALGFESLGMLDEVYPLYRRAAEEVASDANLWVKAAECAERVGRLKEAAAAIKKAGDLGWKPDPA
jgi:hypothetical protein